MKKLIAYLLIFNLANAANAQIRRDVPPNPNDSIPKISKREMMDELGLTKDQRVQWKQIHQNEKAQKAAIMSNDSLSADQKQFQLKQLHKQTNQDINSILTEEQREKMREIKQEMKQSKMHNPNSPMQDEDPGYNQNNTPTNNTPPPANQ